MGIDSLQATYTYLFPPLSFQRHGFGKYELAYTFEDLNRKATVSCSFGQVNRLYNSNRKKNSHSKAYEYHGTLTQQIHAHHPTTKDIG